MYSLLRVPWNDSICPFCCGVCFQMNLRLIPKKEIAFRKSLLVYWDPVVALYCEVCTFWLRGRDGLYYGLYRDVVVGQGVKPVREPLLCKNIRHVEAVAPAVYRPTPDIRDISLPHLVGTYCIELLPARLWNVCLGRMFQFIRL